MQGLLIADEDLDSRKSMADLFIEAGYNVMVTNSAANVLYGILKKTAQVVLLSSEFDELTATDLVPILKKCDQNLTIILVSNEVSLPLMRKLRKEGIFYHALKPVNPKIGKRYARQWNVPSRTCRGARTISPRANTKHKGDSHENTTNNDHNHYPLDARSAPGFCSHHHTCLQQRPSGSGLSRLLRLVVVIQMIPAILTLWGIVKELVAGKGKEKEAKVEIRH